MKGLTLKRKPLFIILGVLVLVNMFTWGLHLFVSDDEITPYVYLIDRSGSSSTFEKASNIGLDPYFTEKDTALKFIVITKNDKNLLPLVERFKVTGSQATIVTDGSGQKVLERHTKILSVDELKAVADKY